MEIASVRTHKVISVDFFLFLKNRSNKSILLNLQMPEFSTTVKMNTLIFTFHFLLHNYMAHLSNVLKISRIFATQ
jgi:ABC-type uncharacterized transport system substrate-binding protein